MSATDWKAVAAETHAKLVEAREQLARATQAANARVTGVRAELLAACEAAYDALGEPLDGRSHMRQFARARLREAISRAGGGG